MSGLASYRTWPAILASCVATLACAAASAGEPPPAHTAPWFDPAWPWRQIVHVDQPEYLGTFPTGAATIEVGNLARPDAADVRVASANSVELGGRFLSIRAVPIEPGQANRIVVINDVTQAMKTREALEEANKALDALSRTDPLTGIANRRWSDERIQREWRRMQRDKKPITILLCDVDLFKQFNDRFGHPAGDDCLRFVADRLSELARRPADLAARFGGDEFAVIFPDTHEQGAGHLARTLKASIGAFDFSDITTGEKAAITLSIGTATAYLGKTRTPEKLISLADEALYKAKKAGRNRIVSLKLDP